MKRGDVIYRDDNLVKVNFNNTKRGIMECLETAERKLDPKAFLTNYEIHLFEEALNDLELDKDKIADEDWNFLIALVIITRGEECKNVVHV